jgi:hypothetical protein
MLAQLLMSLKYLNLLDHESSFAIVIIYLLAERTVGELMMLEVRLVAGT